ncbi:MAG: hypothetical protein QOF41_2244 [Methylobacteriaceae bacterium]|nr:hypothetical protein [Methylobacteriaceae bacterium]
MDVVRRYLPFGRLLLPVEAANAARARFDPAFYRSEYLDVATSGIEPQEHYDRFGQAEGRYPNELAAVGFDLDYYLRENPDVAQSNIDPGQHYLAFGRKQGRHPNATSALIAALGATEIILSSRRQNRPNLSVIVVVHNMAREAPRTLLSLSAAYQQHMDASEYEIIVVDNGSTPPLSTDVFAGLDGNFRLIRVDSAPPSPARAINIGLAAARGEVIGVMIDGARLVTPGFLHFGRAGARLYPRSILVSLGWHLGLDQQRWSIQTGYNRDREDALLQSIGWPQDGYRLFEVGALDEPGVHCWFGSVYESNGLFLTRQTWDLLGGLDERFDAPGGGLVNHDTMLRALELPDAELVVLLGEGTFHQLHGGLASNADAAGFPDLLRAWADQYERIRGKPYRPLSKANRSYLGKLPPVALTHFARSIIEPIGPSPIGPDFDRTLWTFAPAPRPLDPRVAELVDLAETEFRARHFEAAASIARIARALAPNEAAPQRLLASASPWGRDKGEPPDERRAGYHLARGKAFNILGQKPEAEAEFDAAAAALAAGQTEGRHAIRIPAPKVATLVAEFDADFYLETNPDVVTAGLDPLEHYLVYGHAEGRHPSRRMAEFDPEYYLRENPDVPQSGLDPRQHYLSIGRDQGRFPNKVAAAKAAALAAGFDGAFYLRSNPDVARAGVDPLFHFVHYGKAEGRSPSPFARLRTIGTLRLSDLCNPYSKEPSPEVYDPDFCVSVITPTYNISPRYLRELFQTLANQFYSNWEWVLVDDGSSNPATIAMLRSLADLDRRVRVLINSRNLGISAASNIAIGAAKGTHAALVDHDDLVSRDGFLAIYKAWKSAPSTQLFYTDECKLSADDAVQDVWPKPDWSPAYLENTMCLGHLSVYELGFLRSLGGFRSEYDGTQDFDLALRASLAKPNVVHVPIFAYLWRVIPGSAALNMDEKHYAIERQGKAVLDYARRLHAGATVSPGWSPGYWRIVYPLPAPSPLLSYVIPTGGGSRMVRGKEIDLVLNCVRSLEEKTFYANREYVIVHNGNLSFEQTSALEAIPGVNLVHYTSVAFNFSEKLNCGVAAARGEYLCLLNDDVEAITPSGGEELVSYLAANPQVGAIGPKCLREDDTVQQNGVVLITAGPAHAGDRKPRYFGGPYSLLRCRREAFGIGGAIFFIKKDVYKLMEGFAQDLPLNYNDIDLCLKLRESGYTCVVDPYVEVYHFESSTRINASPVNEQELLFLKHPGLNDPFFSPWFDQDNPNYRLKLDRQCLDRPFGHWLDRHIPGRAAACVPSGRVKFSVCIPVFNQPKRLLEEMYTSLLLQTYENKEIVILNNGSSHPETIEWLEAARREERAIVIHAEENLGISGGNLKLLEAAIGDFFVPVDADDFLSIDALQMLAYAIEQNPCAKLFYSDEYKSNLDSTRFAPFFKPDFDPVLLMNCCYPTHLMAINTEFLREIGSYTDERATWSHDYDTLTRALAIGVEPVHVRELLYAWRINPGSTASAATSQKSETVDSQRFVLTRLLNELHLDEVVTLEPNTLETSSGMWRLKALRPIPKVEILAAGEVWEKGGAEFAGLVAIAEQSRSDWIAILLNPDDPIAVHELSAIAHFHPRVNAVGGVLVDEERKVRWSGGLFLPGGRLFDPFVGQSFAEGGYHGELWCQRCVDVLAPVNVLVRTSAIIRAARRLNIENADDLMVALALEAHESGALLAVTPHLQAEPPPSSLVLPPADRKGMLVGIESLARGSRWYDGRLEFEHPYTMPGLAPS